MKRTRNETDSGARRNDRFGGVNPDVELDYEEAKESAPSHTQGPLDPSTGQRAAFPIIDNVGGDDDPDDVMSYLKSVRVEAELSPLFVSTKENFQPRPIQVEEPKPEGEEAAAASTNTGDRYDLDISKHQEFLKVFKQRRLEFENVDAEILESYPASRKEWRKLMTSGEPSAAVVASLSGSTVIRLLEFVHGWVAQTIPPYLDSWILMLLVRLPDTITGGDIAILRGLARKCYWVRRNKQVDSRVGDLLDQVIGVIADFYNQYDIMPCVRSDINT